MRRSISKCGGIVLGLTIAEALRNAIHDEMERDKNVFCIGKILVSLVDLGVLLPIYHSDGNTTEIIDDLIGCGFCAHHPIKPKALTFLRLKQIQG